MEKSFLNASTPTLSVNERSIIVAVEHSARQSYKEISDRTGLSAITVQRSIAKMKLRGILRNRYPYVAPAKLGFSMNAMFVTLNPLGFSKLPLLLEGLVQDSQVEWCSTMTGRFNLALSYYSKNSRSSQTAFLERFTQHAGRFIHDRKQSLRLESMILGRRYLSVERFATQRIVTTSDVEVIQLDELDHRILSVLCNQGYHGERFLAHELKVPAATIHRRLAHLHESGVILADIYDLNSSIVEFRAKVLLFASTSSSKLYASLMEFSITHSNVVFIARYEGAWDAEATLESESSLELEALIQSLLAKLSGLIAAVEVLGVFRDVKYQSYPGR